MINIPHLLLYLCKLQRIISCFIWWGHVNQHIILNFQIWIIRLHWLFQKTIIFIKQSSLKFFQCSFNLRPIIYQLKKFWIFFIQNSPPIINILSLCYIRTNSWYLIILFQRQLINRIHIHPTSRRSLNLFNRNCHIIILKTTIRFIFKISKSLTRKYSHKYQ